MRSRKALGISCALTIAFVACSSSKSPSPNAGDGMAASAGADDESAGANALGGSGVSGNHGGQHSGGADNSSAGDSGSAGEAGTDVGSGGDGTGATGGSSVAGGSGVGSPVPDVNGVPQLPDFAGPTPDQKPLLVTSSYALPAAPNNVVVQVAFDSKWELVLALTNAQIGGAVDFGTIAKLDPAFTTAQWIISNSCGAQSAAGCKVSTSLDGFNRGLAIGPDDSIYFGGENAAAGTYVSKLDSTGASVWTKGWTNAGGTGNDTDYVAAAPDGSVFGWGNGYGQAPGNPPANAGGDVLALYQPDGTRTFLTQVPPFHNNSTSIGNLLVDATGNAYVGFLDYGDLNTKQSLAILKVSPAGKVLATKEVAALNSFEHARLANDQKSIYLLQFKTVAGHGDAQIFALGLDGSVAWYRNLHIHTEVIDPVEGVTWTGLVSEVSDLQVTKDSIYISGLYQDTYMNGSTPRPSVIHGFVTRLGLDGTQQWFQDFQFDGGTKSPVESYDQSRLAVGADGSPLAFFTAQNTATGTGQLYMLKLNKSDGTLTPWH